MINLLINISNGNGIMLVVSRLGSSAIFSALISINQATKMFEQCLIISSVSSKLEIIAKNVFTALHTMIVWPKASFFPAWL